MADQNGDFNELCQDLAERFGALARVFGDLASPSEVSSLLEGLIEESAEKFGNVVDKVDLQLFGKCFWLREVIERVVSTPVQVEVCYLRADLTAAERRLYLVLARRHGQQSAIVPVGGTHLVPAQAEIPPGPLLDELKANNLVECSIQWRNNISTELVLGKPERVCV